MITYTISYKLFDEEKWDWSDGTMTVKAASHSEAIAKAQQTIGLHVMECKVCEAA